MGCRDQIYTRKLKRKQFYDIVPEHEKPRLIKLMNARFRKLEVDDEYEWLVKHMLALDEQTDDVKCKVQDDFNEPENENEDEDEDEEDVVDKNDEDPQYRMFWENLTEHGKAYKLRISQNDEEPRYLYYEEPDDSDDLQTGIDDSGDELTVPQDLQINQISTKKEVTRSKKINNHKTLTLPDQDMIVDPCYQTFFNNGSIPSVPVAVKSEENLLEYEKNVTTSDSDSDIVMLDSVQNGNEVNNKQLVLAENESSLREKLLHILKQPYNDKEYEELSEYIKEKKPMCRHLDLRGRPVSLAVGGVEKSMLDDGPGSFRRTFNAAQNDPPKALNLLRMFCFWLEHVPNEDFFVPWRDKCILEVRPSEKRRRLLDK